MGLWPSDLNRIHVCCVLRLLLVWHDSFHWISPRERREDWSASSIFSANKSMWNASHRILGVLREAVNGIFNCVDHKHGRLSTIRLMLTDGQASSQKDLVVLVLQDHTPTSVLVAKYGRGAFSSSNLWFIVQNYVILCNLWLVHLPLSGYIVMNQCCYCGSTQLV